MSSMADSVLSRGAPRERREAAGETGERIPLWVFPLVAVFLLVIYAVGYDQGLLLYLVFGEASTKANYIHEFAHDGRHLLAFACH